MPHKFWPMQEYFVFSVRIQYSQSVQLQECKNISFVVLEYDINKVCSMGGAIIFCFSARIPYSQSVHLGQCKNIFLGTEYHSN